MSSKHHILFDLDGTLTDSFKGIVNSVQYALSRYGIVIRDEQQECAGQPARRDTFPLHSLGRIGIHVLSGKIRSGTDIFKCRVLPHTRELRILIGRHTALQCREERDCTGYEDVRCPLICLTGRLLLPESGE